MTEKESVYSREKLLGSLEDSTRRLKEARAAKKRDAAVHRENIGSIQDEIDEIMGQLDEMKV